MTNCAHCQAADRKANWLRYDGRYICSECADSFYGYVASDDLFYPIADVEWIEAIGGYEVKA